MAYCENMDDPKYVNNPDFHDMPHSDVHYTETYKVKHLKHLFFNNSNSNFRDIFRRWKSYTKKAK